MEDDLRKQLVPGARVTVTQQIPARDRTWTTKQAGVIVEYEQQKTGSWYAHARDDKLWLDRLVLRKADGEILTLNLDDYSRIEVDAPPAAPAAEVATTA